MIESGAVILANYLIARGFGNWPGTVTPWVINHDAMPEGTGSRITVYDAPSMPLARDPSRVAGPNPPGGGWVEYHGWQFRVRAADDPTVRTKMAAVMADIDAMYYYTLPIGLENFLIKSISRAGRPTFLREEEKSRQRIWVLSGYADITQT